jgi:hypothetical protein
METDTTAATYVLDRMVSRLQPSQRQAFEAGSKCGYIIIHPDEQDLQHVWTLWCMQRQQPDVRVQVDGEFSSVSMHLGPARSSLSADGMVAVRRMFERCGDKANHYQTRNWCKHVHVDSDLSRVLAQRLIEIAYLDGVVQD